MTRISNFLCWRGNLPAAIDAAPVDEAAGSALVQPNLPARRVSSVARLGAASASLISATTFAASPTPSIQISIADTSIKVRPQLRLPAQREPRLELAAARNEEESAQLVLRSGGAVERLTLVAEPLRSNDGKSIPATAINLLLAHQVKVEKRSDAHGEAGEWPDPLVPLRAEFSLRAERSQGIWVQVHVGPEVGAGTYRGKLTLRQDGNQIAQIPLQLTVWNITLPTAPSLPMLVGLDYEIIDKFERGNRSDEAMLKQVLPGYYASLQRNRVAPIFIYDAWPGYRDNGQQVELDMAPFWQKVEAALGEGAATMPIAIPFSESRPVDSARYPLLSPEYKTRVVRYLRAVAQAFKQRGALQRSFIFLASADEPRDAAQIARIREFAELAREADPGLRLLQTVHAACGDCEAGAHQKLRDEPMLWAPNLAYFDGKALRPKRLFRSFEAGDSGWTLQVSAEFKRVGRAIWWYFNPWTFLLDQPPAYPTLFIDHPGIEHRAAAWLAYTHRIAGLGYWQATYWRAVGNPWQTVPRGEGGNGTAGDGVLLYPAAGAQAATGQPTPAGPVTTIRLELLRKGAEDHALLDLARANHSKQVDQIIAPLTRSLTEFERDPAVYQVARRRVAALLENTKNKLGSE